MSKGIIIAIVFTILMGSLIWALMYIIMLKKKYSSMTQARNYKILRDILKSVIKKNINEAGDNIISILRANFDLDYITIFTYDNSNKKLSPISTTVEKKHLVSIEQYINSIYEEKLRGGDAYIMVSEKESIVLSYPTAPERKINYLYIIPLKMGSSLIGVLMIENSSISRIDHEEFFTLVADNISIVMDDLKHLQQIELSAMVDGLTNVYNRVHMDKYLHEEFRKYKATNKVFSLCMLDIDHFKKFNDTHGHLMGDYVLKRTAAVLKENMEKGSTVFRFGGEEFLIFMPECHPEEAYNRLEKIRTHIQSLELEKKDKSIVKVTASFGVCTYPIQENRDLKDVIKSADKALYKAKEHGRNRVVSYNKDME